MHGSFILFMKWELSNPTLLGISSEITTFLGVTIFKTALISIEDTGIKSTYIKSAFVRGTCAKSPCTGGASTVKHLGMNSQSF